MSQTCFVKLKCLIQTAHNSAVMCEVQLKTTNREGCNKVHECKHC